MQSETEYCYQRGVLTSQLDYYVINPLSPGRVRRSGHTAQPHVIFRSQFSSHLSPFLTSLTSLKQETQVEELLSSPVAK